jgi:hypothetical protein
MHLFYYLFLFEIVIAVVAFTNVAEYVFMPVKQRTVTILSDKRQLTYLVAALGVMLFIHAFRDPLSLEDTPFYYRAIEEARLMTISDVFARGYFELKTETGFAVLLKIIVDVFHFPQMLFVLTSAFIFFSFFVAIKRFSPILWLSVLVLMTDSFPQSLFILRGFLALCILLFSIPYIIKRQFLPYLLLCLIAISIHTTSVIFFPVYFIYGIKNALFLALFLLIGGVTLVWGFDIILPYVVENFVSEYSVYILEANNYEGGNWKMPALLSAILLFRIVVMKDHFFEEGINRFCSVVLILAFVLYIAGLGFGLISRMALYFSNFTFLILPNTVQYIRSAKLQFGAALIYVLFNSIFFLKSASGVFWVDYQLISI